MFVTSNLQTTNLGFPNFFHDFFSVLAVEKEKRQLLIGQKIRKKTFWTNRKFVFFFNYLNWEKFVEKLGKTRFVVWWFDIMNNIMASTLRHRNRLRIGNFSLHWPSDTDFRSLRALCSQPSTKKVKWIKVALSENVFHVGFNLPKNVPITILSSIDAQDSFWQMFWEIWAKLKNFLRLSHL